MTGTEASEAALWSWQHPVCCRTISSEAALATPLRGNVSSPHLCKCNTEEQTSCVYSSSCLALRPTPLALIFALCCQSSHFGSKRTPILFLREEVYVLNKRGKIGLANISSIILLFKNTALSWNMTLQIVPVLLIFSKYL